ncbi:MAG: LptF/LptG family permease [Planctomycetota bacterium]
MRLLERYVLSELLRVFGILVTVSTSLLVFVGAFSQAKEYGLGHWQILQILPFIVPSLLPYTIPATLLLTVCVVYGRMSGDNEIIAAKAAGISVLSLMWPSFFLSGLLSVSVLLFSDQVIPWAFGNIERIATLAMEDIFIDRLKTQSTISVPEQGITIIVLGVRDRTLIGPVIRYAPKGHNAVTVTAKEARVSFDLPRDQVWLELHGAASSLPGQQNSAYLEYDVIAFPLPGKSQRLRGRDLSIDDIQRELPKLASSRQRAQQLQAMEAAIALTTGNFDLFDEPEFQSHQSAVADSDSWACRLRTEQHNRFAMAVSCFFFVMLGSPFAILMARNQFLTSFLFCFVPILVIYYPISMMSLNLSKTGAVDPAWAVWSANGLLGLIASYILRRVLRH